MGGGGDTRTHRGWAGLPTLALLPYFPLFFFNIFILFLSLSFPFRFFSCLFLFSFSLLHLRFLFLLFLSHSFFPFFSTACLHTSRKILQTFFVSLAENFNSRTSRWVLGAVRVGKGETCNKYPIGGRSHSSSVSIVIRLRIRRLEFDSRQGQELFFSRSPRPESLRSIQAPIKRVPGVKRPDRKANNHPHLAPRLRKRGDIPPLPPMCLHGLVSRGQTLPLGGATEFKELPDRC
jgi:hypothetical protein